MTERERKVKERERVKLNGILVGKNISSAKIHSNDIFFFLLIQAENFLMDDCKKAQTVTAVTASVTRC